MNNSYLLEVIKALSPAEREEISIFLTSPVLNQGSNASELARLYQIILQGAPNFNTPALHKDQVYAQIYPGQKPVAGKLEKLMADLNKLVRNQALSKRYLQDDNEHQQQIDWAAWLRDRGLYERAKQLLTKLKHQKRSQNVESFEDHRLLFLLENENHEIETLENQVKGDLNIPNVVHHLDLYYYNYRAELENRYLLQQKGTFLPMFDFSNPGIDYYRSESVLLNISKTITQILQNESPNVEEFQHLMELLHLKEHNLSNDIIILFYAYLRNACTILINNGNLDLVPVLHKVNKDNLLRGLFFIQGELSAHAYTNLVQIAIRAHDIDWAKEFIEQYRHRLIGGDEGQFFYHLNMAHCLFSEGKYNEALDIIPDAPSSSHYHRRVRRLELRIFYELKSDLLHYKIFAFRKFIERTAPKTINASFRAMDLNFLNLLLQLTQSPAKDKKRSLQLTERIQKKKLLADRAWLLEKAKELG